MSYPTLTDSRLRLTDSIYYGQIPLASVPLSRNINTTLPLTGGGSLATDLTLGIQVAPPGATTVVGTTRLLTSTAPLHVNAGLSAALTGDVAFTVDVFGDATPGVVPASGGGAVNVLFADRTWAPVAGGAGVPSTRLINTALPLTGGGSLAADLNLAVILAGVANTGVVPATGGADPTKFLCATSPLTWVVPGVPGGITLQSSFPGVVDVGGGYISGAMVAGFLSAGAAQSVGKISAFGVGGDIHLFAGSWAAGDPDPQLFFRAGRGTLTAPTSLATLDTLFDLKVQGRGTAAYSNPRKLMFAIVDGAPSASDFNTRVQIHAGTSLTPAKFHGSTTGWRFSTGEAVAADTPTALSGVEINTTLGIWPRTIVYADSTAGVYQILDTDPPNLLIDASANTFVVKLPTAVGRKGRTWTMTRVDATSKISGVFATGAETMEGRTETIYLTVIGDTVTLVSDGANWFWTSVALSRSLATAFADSAALANTVTDTSIFNGLAANTSRPGAVIGFRAYGKYSTTGTPTLRFRIKDTNTVVLFDSGAITTGAGIATGSFQIDCACVVRSTAGFQTVMPVRAVLHLGNSTGVLTSYTMGAYAAIAGVTGDGPFDIFAQWGTANPANTLTLNEAEITVDQRSRIN